MSIQHAPDELAIIAVTGPGACAQPALVSEPIDEASAAGLAQVFKALCDPVRLRLVSLIGAREGGEVCVCDLTSAKSSEHNLRNLYRRWAEFMEAGSWDELMSWRQPARAEAAE